MANAVSAKHPLTSVARIVGCELPAVVGVPAYTPVVAFSISPGGNVPDATLHITASPEAMKVVLKAVPTAAAGSGESGAEIAGRRRSSSPLSLQAVSKDALIRIATEPNFITQKLVTAEVRGVEDPSQLAGRIICIRSADPGYDWLFSRDIAGVVTAYGGANSHMAIRANELGLPAVIGAGEANFQTWSRARRLSVDCANRKVMVLE